MAVVCRDSTWNVLTGTTWNIFALSATVDEALAVRLAVKMASNLAIQDVVFESNCLPVIEACTGNLGRLDLEHIIKDISHIKI